MPRIELHTFLDQYYCIGLVFNLTFVGIIQQQIWSVLLSSIKENLKLIQKVEGK